MPLGHGFPLAGIGQLVRIDAGAQTDQGTVNSLTVEARTTSRGLSVRQQIGLGEDTPNHWSRFRQLLPGRPTRIAEVVATHGQTTTVELLTGHQIRVRGSASVGDHVYIRDGQIISPAPDLPGHQIQV